MVQCFTDIKTPGSSPSTVERRLFKLGFLKALDRHTPTWMVAIKIGWLQHVGAYMYCWLQENDWFLIYLRNMTLPKWDYDLLCNESFPSRVVSWDHWSWMCCITAVTRKMDPACHNAHLCHELHWTSQLCYTEFNIDSWLSGSKFGEANVAHSDANSLLPHNKPCVYMLFSAIVQPLNFIVQKGVCRPMVKQTREKISLYRFQFDVSFVP